MLRTSSPLLQPIREKIESGERLSLEDGLVLELPDVPLPEVGELANFVRERKNGNFAYYNINTHLNPTNVCVYRCVFCAFRSDLRDPKGYLMNDEQILARGAEAVENGCTEMHIVGGLHHQSKYDYYLNVIRLLHEAYPELHLKAWTPVEIDWFCRLAKKSVREILEDMVDAGLGSLPGGGAEIFHPEVRNQICEHKADSRRWFEVHRTAHELGLRSNCTMLYGHIEQPYHRIDHLLRLRELQDATGGFQTFIPLAFHPENTVFERRGWRHTTGSDDLKMLAVSRLVLDNIPNVKAYWIMMGMPLAAVALHFGANDVQGTVVREEIFKAAGGRTGTEQKVDELVRFVREAGRVPVQRDTLYNELRRWQ